MIITITRSDTTTEPTARNHNDTSYTIISTNYDDKLFIEIIDDDEMEWVRLGWNNPIKIRLPKQPDRPKIELRTRNRLLNRKCDP